MNGNGGKTREEEEEKRMGKKKERETEVILNSKLLKEWLLRRKEKKRDIRLRGREEWTYKVTDPSSVMLDFDPNGLTDAMFSGSQACTCTHSDTEHVLNKAVAFFWLVRIWGEGLTIHSPTALFILLVKVEISSCTLIPLLGPGSVHSSSANWNDCGGVLPDELHVSLFPW